MSSWHATSLPVLSLLAAVLELDQANLAHTMVSRPIVLGPILGAACGDPLSGALLGALIEALSLDQSPTGAVIPLNGPVAAACAVLLRCSPHQVPEAAALPVGLLLGGAFRAVESRLRSGRSGLCADALRQIEREGRVLWAPLMAKSVGAHLAAVALFVYISVIALAAGLAGGWAAAPEWGREGLRAAFSAAPWLGAVSLARLLWRRAGWKTA